MLQALNGDLSRWTHVFVVLDGKQVFEAQPGGAIIAPLCKYGGREVAYLPYTLTPEQQAGVIWWARSLAGTGYNWTTYFYLAAYRLRLPVLTRVLRWRVERSDKLICSQAADFIYRQNGVHLFNDGRLPYDVTPGDFEDLL